MAKGSKKNDRRDRIIVFSFMVALFTYLLIASLIKEGFGFFTIFSLVFLLLGAYVLITEIFPQLGGSNKKFNNPSIEDLNKVDKGFDKPLTEEEIAYRRYNEMAKNNSFVHPVYGEISVSVDGIWKYSGPSLCFDIKQEGVEVIVNLEKDANLDEFIQNVEIKNKIIDVYHKLVDENKNKLREYLIDNEYKNIWEWITEAPFDTEDSVYYTGNKTMEEFKKALIENFELELFSISVNNNYEVDYLFFSSYVQELAVELGVKIVDGKVDYGTIDTNLTMG